MLRRLDAFRSYLLSVPKTWELRTGMLGSNSIKVLAGLTDTLEYQVHGHC